MSETNGRPVDYEVAFHHAQDQLALQQMDTALKTRLFGRYGLTHGGARNLPEVLGYLEHPTIKDFWDYSMRGLGSRIVSLFPDETWANLPTVQENPDPGNNTPFELDWAQLCRLHDVWGAFKRLDRLAQIGEYAVLVVGLEGISNFQIPVSQQAQPRGPESVMYLRPYWQERAEVVDFNQEELSRDFGQPTAYKITVRVRSEKGANGAQINEKNIFVHASHVIHFADNILENETFGIPILNRVIDRIFDLDKQVGGLAEMAFIDAKRRIIAVLRDGVQFKNEDDRIKQQQQVQAFAHGMTSFLRLSGADVQVADGVVPNISDNILRTMQLLAGTLPWPMRKLFGSEQGQLATEEDNRQASKQILARFARDVIPRIVRPFIDRMILHGVLRAPAAGPDGYEILLPDLLALSPQEQAQVDKAYTEAYKTFVEAQLLGGAEINVLSFEEFRRKGLSGWDLEPGLPAPDLEPEEEEDDDDTTADDVP